MTKKEKTKKQMPKGTVTEKLKKEFTFPLTQSDRADLGSKAADLSGQIAKEYAELDEIKKEKTAAIRAKEAERDNFLAIIRARKENRVVEATVIRNFEAKLVQYWYQGKLLEERAMTADECQMPLPLKGRKKPETEKKEMTGAQKTYAKAKGKLEKRIAEEEKLKGAGNEIADSIKEETNRKTKRSAVDGPSSGIYGNA